MKKIKGRKGITVPVNPKIFALEVIYSAAYMLLDKAYITIDGDPEKKIFVQIIPKNKEDPERIALEFKNELINYSVYAVQAARTSALRNAIVQRALGVLEGYEEFEDRSKPVEAYVESLEDPLGIAKPWTPDKMKGIEVPEEVKEIFKSIKEKCEDESEKDR